MKEINYVRPYLSLKTTKTFYFTTCHSRVCLTPLSCFLLNIILETLWWLKQIYIYIYNGSRNLFQNYIALVFKLIHQFSLVTQSCPTLCDPMNHSTPGLPVHHQLLEFTQTHVHRVRDAIQPSHPGSSPSPPAPNPSQHHSLFQWVISSHELAKVLEFQLLVLFLPKKSQGWSPSEWTGWISLQSKGLSRLFSNTTVQKHPFFSTQLSSQSNSHIHTWP